MIAFAFLQSLEETMKTFRVRLLTTTLLIGVLALTSQMAPALASDGSDRVRPVEITFTKWVRVVDGFRLLEGFTGAGAPGSLAGEVLQSQLSYDGAIQRMEAIYQVLSGDRSFTALIRGGRTTDPGDAILDGVVLAGWRTGAPVHVEFKVIPATSPLDPACLGAPAGLTCFQGTIRVGRVPRD